MTTTLLLRTLAIVLFGLTISFTYQNCAKVNFTSTQKGLVQGTAAPLISSTEVPTVSVPPESGNPGDGLCVLTCKEEDDGGDMDNKSDSGDKDGAGIDVSAKSCDDGDKDEEDADNQDGDHIGKNMKLVQSVNGDDPNPKNACMSKSACQAIDDHLKSGRLTLAKAMNGHPSALRHAAFKEAHESECEIEVSDDEVERDLEKQDGR